MQQRKTNNEKHYDQECYNDCTDFIMTLICLAYMIFVVVMISLFSIRISMNNKYNACITSHPEVRDEEIINLLNAVFVTLVINLTLYLLAVTYTFFAYIDFECKKFGALCALFFAAFYVLGCALSVLSIKRIGNTGYINVDEICKTYGNSVLWGSSTLNMQNLVVQLSLSIAFFGLMVTAIIINKSYQLCNAYRISKTRIQGTNSEKMENQNATNESNIITNFENPNEKLSEKIKENQDPNCVVIHTHNDSTHLQT
jgi:hypothetical protein